MMYDNIDEANMALREMEMDVLMDMGKDAVEAAWADIVHACAALCTPDVANELLRRQGLLVRPNEEARLGDLVRLPSEGR